MKNSSKVGVFSICGQISGLVLGLVSDQSPETYTGLSMFIFHGFVVKSLSRRPCLITKR